MSGLVAIVFASASLVSGGLSGGSVQDPATAAWRAPAIAPFEAPSAFGRETAQGDGSAPAARVSGRRRAPADLDIDYAARVDEREDARDALSGPLDGAWRLLDRRGHQIGALVLSQPRADAPVSGAADMGAHDLYLDGGAHGADAVLNLPDGGRLRLRRAANGWTGEMHHAGLNRAVILVR